MNTKRNFNINNAKSFSQLTVSNKLVRPLQKRRLLQAKCNTCPCPCGPCPGPAPIPIPKNIKTKSNNFIWCWQTFSKKFNRTKGGYGTTQTFESIDLESGLDPCVDIIVLAAAHARLDDNDKPGVFINATDLKFLNLDSAYDPPSLGPEDSDTREAFKQTKAWKNKDPDNRTVYILLGGWGQGFWGFFNLPDPGWKDQAIAASNDYYNILRDYLEKNEWVDGVVYNAEGVVGSNTTKAARDSALIITTQNFESISRANKVEVAVITVDFPCLEDPTVNDAISGVPWGQIIQALEDNGTEVSHFISQYFYNDRGKDAVKKYICESKIDYIKNNPEKACILSFGSGLGSWQPDLFLELRQTTQQDCTDGDKIRFGGWEFGEDRFQNVSDLNYVPYSDVYEILCKPQNT